MEAVVPFLICFPLVVAVLMFAVRSNRVRNIIAYIGAAAIIAGVGVLTAWWLAGGRRTVMLFTETETVDRIILGAEILLMIVVTILCFIHRKYWISLLSIIPTVMIALLELWGPEQKAAPHIRIDYLSVLMCLIIGVIGSLIVIYAVGYMHGYQHHHTEVRDRRYYFFMVLFLFLGAMFGFVLSTSLLWIDLFWETTSVCSFLLIGYTGTEEAETNSFRALWMNLLGGTALAAGIVYFVLCTGTADLQALVDAGAAGQRVAVLPVALIAFAALTKAAQLPFSTWLVGAMVAPTPSSALLHSATMVKAGIYILFRLSPAMGGTRTGFMISFVGGFTFFATSLLAIAQSDGKKVLAFSTISNLGLMTACAGVGRPETLWAGVFLMLFHAISKSLLFQDVGATENSLHSRDIEDMTGLLFRLPVLAVFMFIGIAGMFLAPFGMLISKWAALKASIDSSNIFLVFFICFGSATTTFYWTKWMGKIITHRYDNAARIPDKTKPNEYLSLGIHAVMMILLCLIFPLLSVHYVDPLVQQVFQTSEAPSVLSIRLLYVLVAVIILVFLVPVMAYIFSKKIKTNEKLSYMNGVNGGDNMSFINSFGDREQLQISNYYFADLVGQRRIMLPVQLFVMAFLLVMLCVIIGGVL